MQRIVQTAVALRSIGAACLVVCCSCSSAESRLPTDTPPDTVGGGIQRASLRVSVSLAPADSALARALAFSGYAVGGASVSVLRLGSTAPIVRQTDGSGDAQFTDLLPGAYLVSIVRLLSSTEQIALPASIGETDAIGGAGSVSVAAPSASVNVLGTPSQRGSLVISEVWSGDPRVGTSYYNTGDFFEIYNNSDGAVPLADKLVFAGFPGTFFNPDLDSCTASAPFQRDSLGIWATFIYRFPPDAPLLQAGGVALMATDAIDHTFFTPLAFDLRSAAFEFRGGADADNPSVPDMISVGPSDGGDLGGRGLRFYMTHPVLALANAADLASLPSQLGGGDRTWLRIPTDALLDVTTWGPATTTFQTCGSPVHPSQDAQQAKIIGDWSIDLRSITRRSIATHVDGRKILLRTKNSANDFVGAEPSPGRVQ